MFFDYAYGNALFFGEFVTPGSVLQNIFYIGLIELF